MEELHFPPFRLDLLNERLYRGPDAVPLRPKAYAVLRHLAEHPDRLIFQAELSEAIWGHSHQSDGLLRGYIREVRRVLGDDSRSPRFIETISSRGYRFLPAVTRSASCAALDERRGSVGMARTRGRMSYFVGRAEELQWLHARVDSAANGVREVVWLSGNPGIGKTALAEVFLSQAASHRPVWVARGQCVEQHGHGEPYLPILDALGRLAQDAREPLAAALRRYAPSWLAHLPALHEAGERAQLLAARAGLTQERMARELAEALEALSRDRPLLMLIEDLHWSDPSSIRLLDVLARRIEPARLLLVGTFRSAEAAAPGHPLRSVIQELRSHDLCADLPLRSLSQDEVAAYVTLRFALEPGSGDVEAGARRLHRRTDGVPLFLRAVIDDLVAGRTPEQAAADLCALGGSDRLEGTDVPDGLFHIFARQIERLPIEEQQLLGAASVIGMEFSAALLAAVEGLEHSQVEALCEGLVSADLFLCVGPRWRGPERRATERYRFRHAMERDTLHRRLPLGGLRRLNRRVGECKLTLYGDRCADIATELASHFEMGGDVERSVQYLLQAAQQSMQRVANREAIAHLERALRLLARLPASLERNRQELQVQACLATPLLMTQGHTTPAVRQAFSRAFELAESVGSTPRLLPSLFGLYRHALVGGDLSRAHKLAEQMMQAAEGEPGRPQRGTACLAVGSVLYHRGEFKTALASIDECLQGRDIEAIDPRFLEHGEDEVTIALAHASWLYTLLGYPAKGGRRAGQLRARVKSLEHPFARFETHALLAYLGFVSRDSRAALVEANAALALGCEHGLSPLIIASIQLHRGWALAMQGQAAEALGDMRESFAMLQAAGVRLWIPFAQLQLGEAIFLSGDVVEGLRQVEEAAAAQVKMGADCWLPECHRVAADILLQCAGTDQHATFRAEAALVEAIAVARKQESRLLELRAASSLVQLHRRMGRADDAQRALAEIYGWFREGFDHHDLVLARGLLEEVGLP